MFLKKIPNPKKAKRLETKADQQMMREKWGKALQYYEKSQLYDPENPDIYPKLNLALEKSKETWSQEDFEKSMSWTMKLQELENPQIKSVYEKFSAEYQEIQKLIQQLMLSLTEEEEIKITNQIIAYGDKAHRPILDFLLSIKKLGNNTEDFSNLSGSN